MGKSMKYFIVINKHLMCSITAVYYNSNLISEHLRTSYNFGVLELLLNHGFSFQSYFSMLKYLKQFFHTNFSDHFISQRVYVCVCVCVKERERQRDV